MTVKKKKFVLNKNKHRRPYMQMVHKNFPGERPHTRDIDTDNKNTLDDRAFSFITLDDDRNGCTIIIAVHTTSKPFFYCCSQQYPAQSDADGIPRFSLSGIRIGPEFRCINVRGIQYVTSANYGRTYTPVHNIFGYII